MAARYDGGRTGRCGYGRRAGRGREKRRKREIAAAAAFSVRVASDSVAESRCAQSSSVTRRSCACPCSFVVAVVVVVLSVLVSCLFFFSYFIYRSSYVCFSVCRFSPRFPCYSPYRRHSRFRPPPSCFRDVRPPRHNTLAVRRRRVEIHRPIAQCRPIQIGFPVRFTSPIRRQTSEHQRDMWAKSAAGRLIVVGSLLVLVTGKRKTPFIIG